MFRDAHIPTDRDRAFPVTQQYKPRKEDRPWKEGTCGGCEGPVMSDQASWSFDGQLVHVDDECEAKYARKLLNPQRVK